MGEHLESVPWGLIGWRAAQVAVAAAATTLGVLYAAARSDIKAGREAARVRWTDANRWDR
jgi:hypothetical protein